jgi:hypothetical protein
MSDNPLGTGSTGRPSRSTDESSGASERAEDLKKQMEDLVRVNADVPQSLRRWLQVQAAREDRAMRKIVIDALESYRAENG